MATLTAAEITFSTTADDKDWDTKPFADILLDGRNIATLDCCSSDRDKDHWSDQSDPVTKSLIIRENAPKEDILAKGTCVLGAQAGPHGGGNDEWKFNASLTLHFSDGSIAPYGGPGWDGIELRSHSRSHESTNPISLHA